VAKHVTVERCHNGCLWRAFLGLRIDGKNMHGMNHSKFEKRFSFISASIKLWAYSISACFS
jgi:hypothetical protein